MDKELQDVLDMLNDTPEEKKTAKKEEKTLNPSYKKMVDKIREWQQEKKESRIAQIIIAEQDEENPDGWACGCLTCGTGKNLFHNIVGALLRDDDIRMLLSDAVKCAEDIRKEGEESENNEDNPMIGLLNLLKKGMMN